MYSRSIAILVDEKPVHDVMSGFQNDYRRSLVSEGRDPYGTSLRTEFDNASRWMRNAGVPDADRKRALKQAYKFFDGEGAFRK